MSEAQLSVASPLLDAIRVIEGSRRRIAVVTGGDRQLLGTLTDGDIRRCLLAGGTLDAPVSTAMNPTPTSADWNSSTGHLLALMRRANVLAVPLVDKQGRFQRLVHLSDIDTSENSRIDHSVFSFAVIMAGGEGTRLRPLTETVPKPMLEIGGVSLLERQVQRLQQAKVSHVYIAVNYLSHIIEDHFGNGSAFGINIQYLREPEKLGTAGALALLPEVPKAPIIVMNGDILTSSDINSLYAFHREHDARITVAAADYHVNVPYGVIQSNGAIVRALEEKPSQRFLCNAGIYVLDPEALVPMQKPYYCNMTNVVNDCLSKGYRVAVFPLYEYWSDIGTPDDLEKARALFYKVEATA